MSPVQRLGPTAAEQRRRACPHARQPGWQIGASAFAERLPIGAP
jgi:hypothetical protein